MRTIHSKFITIAIVLAILRGAILDFNFQANADIDQITASFNISHSYEDDSLTSNDAGESSKSISLALADPENLKLFLVLEKYFWLTSKLFYHIGIASSIFSLARDIASNQLARAPPVLI